MKTTNCAAICSFGHLISKISVSLLFCLCLASGSALADQKEKRVRQDSRADDPSQLTGPLIGDLPEDLPDANLGAFEGGLTGTSEDAGESNAVPKDNQRDDGRFNVPSNGPPSPLYSALEFNQQMLRFEEFGPESLNLSRNDRPKNWRPLPAPINSQATDFCSSFKPGPLHAPINASIAHENITVRLLRFSRC